MRRFRTWAGTHTSRPRAWCSPATEAEVEAQLAWAVRHGRRVRPVGSGHSWSDVAVPDDVALDLTRMRQVLDLDVGTRRIRVQAGIRLEELSEALDRAGLAMPILGSIGKQSLAGAISTGTHGSSLRHGNLAALIDSMRLATPRGEVLALDASHPWLPAARVGLGALGVVTEATVRVVPAFQLQESVTFVPITEVEASLESLAAGDEFVKVWWFPTAPEAMVFRLARTERAPVERPLARWFDEQITNRIVFEGVLRLAGRVPSMTAWINRAIVRSYFGAASPPARSFRAFHLAMPPLHRETELAVPIGRAAAVLADVRAAIATHGWRINFPVEIRFVAQDDAWMSPAHGHPTCQIGFYQAQSADLAPYFAAVAAIGREHGGRPHWGKEFDLDASALRPLYPRFDDFVALRRELDPSGTLRSPALDRIFGSDATG